MLRMVRYDQIDGLTQRKLRQTKSPGAHMYFKEMLMVKI